MSSRFDQMAIQGICKTDAVYRLDQGKEGQGLSHLVGLQVSDEVPIHRQIPKLSELLFCLLDSILSDNPNTSRDSFPNPLRRLILGSCQHDDVALATA